MTAILSNTRADVLAEYDAAYEQAQERAAACIWQAIKRGPTPSPDWIVHEWTRPGATYWQRERAGKVEALPFVFPEPGTAAALEWD